jgi:hypothetical protein
MNTPSESTMEVCDVLNHLKTIVSLKLDKKLENGDDKYRLEEVIEYIKPTLKRMNDHALDRDKFMEVAAFCVGICLVMGPKRTLEFMKKANPKGGHQEQSQSITE